MVPNFSNETLYDTHHYRGNGEQNPQNGFARHAFEVEYRQDPGHLIETQAYLGDLRKVNKK